MTGELTAVQAIRGLSETTGERYELEGRLAGGETGAHRVRGPAGGQLVGEVEFWLEQAGSVLTITSGNPPATGSVGGS